MADLNDYLDRMREITGSDYKTAQHLGITRQAVSQARKRGGLGDDECLQIAEAIGTDPIQVIAAANVARTKSPAMRERWERYTGAAAGAFLLVISGVPQEAHAEQGVSSVVTHDRDYAQLH